MACLWACHHVMHAPTSQDLQLWGAKEHQGHCWPPRNLEQLGAAMLLKRCFEISVDCQTATAYCTNLSSLPGPLSTSLCAARVHSRSREEEAWLQSAVGSPSRKEIDGVHESFPSFQQTGSAASAVPRGICFTLLWHKPSRSSCVMSEK